MAQASNLESQHPYPTRTLQGKPGITPPSLISFSDHRLLSVELLIAPSSHCSSSLSLPVPFVRIESRISSLLSLSIRGEIDELLRSNNTEFKLLTFTPLAHMILPIAVQCQCMKPMPQLSPTPQI